MLSEQTVKRIEDEYYLIEKDSPSYAKHGEEWNAYNEARRETAFAEATRSQILLEALKQIKMFKLADNFSKTLIDGVIDKAIASYNNNKP